MSNLTAKNTQRIRYIIADLLTGALAMWVFNMVRFYLLYEVRYFTDLWNYLGSTKLVLEQIIIPPCLLIIYWLSGYYNQPFKRSRLQEFNTTFLSEIVNTVIIYLVLLVNDQTDKRIINYEMIGVLFGTFFLLTYSVRLLITAYAIHHFRKDIWHINVLIIGNSKVARATASKLKSVKRDARYNVSGFVEIPGETSVNDNENVMPLEKLQDPDSLSGIDQVILAPQTIDDKKVMKLLSVLFPLKIPVKISPDTFSFVTSAIKMNDIYAEPFVDLTGPAISESSKNIKRTFDVSVSLFILVILSPVFGIIAALVKIFTKGPVFYHQERIGRYQQPFMIHKFRTMEPNAEERGPQLSNEDDPRVTKIGKWLRKYRLDELPQFWNVFKGEMSIVGPRPEREFYIRKIIEKAPYYTLVCQVRPGITSWGMVKYGYASTVDQMVERTRYDLLYLANMSLTVDCKILIYTIKTVAGGEGV